MKHRVLQIGPITPPADARLARDYDIAPLWKQPDPAAFLAEHGAEFEGIVVHVRDACDASILESLPNAKVIANFGVGYDKIDVDTAKRLGIQISNTPQVLDGCVADLAMGLAIDVARGISTTDRFVRAGGWKSGQRPLMTRVHGKNMGLLGFGGIGQAVGRRAAGFDMTVRYNTRRPVEGFAGQHVASLVELAKWADFLVVACPGGAQTRHLVNAEVLDALGPRGILVNIARGSVVDEAALVRALQEGRLGGAGLDVFENEPNVPEALLAMDNVVALSHIAGFTRESRADMEALVCDNLDAYFRTGRVLTPV
ncbi:hydroxyacid dehydrogenase [Pigmentiphaga sp. NML080357]|uniref:2-hydroxyacid dehydrogenase n=1 Tax=Pigmentiphaga sp. NML080357 TaxID=2008675 RepID=UPI000B40A6C6|nr:2-hydroxyacid dehydrogenase [Pigmentiphaga sp. NML080357]OVZ57367.1 hydroxyacid dehydrogenase [Pigmentiphaga sp. NML080357]